MDKVKDLLKKIQPHQFWILLGIALLLPLWGWWSTTDELAAMTKSRIDAINKAFTQLPKSSERNPNDYWIDGVHKTNEVQGVLLKKAWHSMYDRQVALVKWPEGLGFTDPEKANERDLARYNLRYPKLLQDVHRIVNTVDGQYLVPGPVIFPDSAMPRATWAGGQIPPTVQQMKNAQEDMFLFSSLLRSIQRANGSAKIPLKASVREIKSIRLRGGTLATAAPAAVPPAGGEGPGPMGRGGMRGEGGGEAARNATSASDAAGFDPTEEMGPDPEAGGGAARSGGDGPGRGGMGGPPAPPAPGQDPAVAAQAKRYLEELPQARKRGFYLEVIVEQAKLPQLLVQLSKSEWPVRILHVNLAELRPDSLVPPADEGVPAAARMAAIKQAEANGQNAPGALGLMPGVPPPPPAGLGEAGAADGHHVRADDAAMADPNLAVAAISGYIVIYNPPPADAPSQSGDQTPPTGPVPAGQQAAVQPPANQVPNQVPVGQPQPAAPPGANRPSPVTTASPTTTATATSAPTKTGPTPNPLGTSPPALPSNPGKATPAAPAPKTASPAPPAATSSSSPKK